MDNASFKRTVRRFYHRHGRQLPWRETTDPYAIVVSEVMLQQTQVDRVTPKYREWLETLPDFATLAAAPLRDVLKVWQGLGYNRRALALQRCAVQVVHEYDGVLPQKQDDLVKLPGIGPYTASAVLTFAFNTPTVMIETNIRTVYLHHFFPNRSEVDDKDVLPFIAATLDQRNPREWYWALMDYGVHLKKKHGNPSRRSRQYVKQSPFAGSNRQVRGLIVSTLTERGAMTEQQLVAALGLGAQRIAQSIEQLESEGFIRRTQKQITIL